MAKALEEIAKLQRQIEKLKESAVKELTTDATAAINTVSALVARYVELDARAQVDADLISPMRDVFKKHGFGAQSGGGKKTSEGRRTRTPKAEVDAALATLKEKLPTKEKDALSIADILALSGGSEEAGKAAVRALKAENALKKIGDKGPNVRYYLAK